MTSPALDAELAASIAFSFLNEPIKQITPLVGKGQVNTLFIVHSRSSQVVVRMNDAAQSRHTYAKEQWCLEQAAVRGIPSPTVLTHGLYDGVAYMLLTVLSGTNGEDSPRGTFPIWSTLGRYAQRTHTIPASGFGDLLADPHQGVFCAPLHADFDGSWASFVTYNVDSLTDHDRLRTLGVLTQAQAKILRVQFDALLSRAFTFGLNHGDLSVKNTMVDTHGNISLLDWGNAEVHIIPHWDLVQLLTSHLVTGRPNAAEFHVFLEGYGLSQQQFAAMQNEVATLMVLRTFDTLRWAIDRKPEQIEAYARVAQRALQYKLRQI